VNDATERVYHKMIMAGVLVIVALFLMVMFYMKHLYYEDRETKTQLYQMTIQVRQLQEQIDALKLRVPPDGVRTRQSEFGSEPKPQSSHPDSPSLGEAIEEATNSDTSQDDSPASE